jgi:hypothetical protein
VLSMQASMCQRVGLRRRGAVRRLGSTRTPHLHDMRIVSRLTVALRAKHHRAALLQEGRFTTFEVALAHENFVHWQRG